LFVYLQDVRVKFGFYLDYAQGLRFHPYGFSIQRGGEKPLMPFSQSNFVRRRQEK